MKNDKLVSSWTVKEILISIFLIANFVLVYRYLDGHRSISILKKANEEYQKCENNIVKRNRVCKMTGDEINRQKEICYVEYYIDVKQAKHLALQNQ